MENLQSQRQSSQNEDSSESSESSESYFPDQVEEVKPKKSAKSVKSVKIKKAKKATVSVKKSVPKHKKGNQYMHGKDTKVHYRDVKEKSKIDKSIIVDKPKSSKHKKSDKVKGYVDKKPEISSDMDVKHDIKPDDKDGEQSEDKGSKTSQRIDICPENFHTISSSNQTTMNVDDFNSLNVICKVRYHVN